MKFILDLIKLEYSIKAVGSMSLDIKIILPLLRVVDDVDDVIDK